MQILKKIREFIEPNLLELDDDVNFSDSDNIFEMGIVNSLFAMKLITYIEKEFNITVDFEELEIEDICSVNNIHNFICGSRKN